MVPTLQVTFGAPGMTCLGVSRFVLRVSPAVKRIGDGDLIPERAMIAGGRTHDWELTHHGAFAGS